MTNFKISLLVRTTREESPIDQSSDVMLCSWASLENTTSILNST